MSQAPRDLTGRRRELWKQASAVQDDLEKARRQLRRAEDERSRFARMVEGLELRLRLLWQEDQEEKAKATTQKNERDPKVPVAPSPSRAVHLREGSPHCDKDTTRAGACEAETPAQPRELLAQGATE